MFFYSSIIYLRVASGSPEKNLVATNILTLVGAATLPIKHFSVYWANTIHQLPSVLRSGTPTIDSAMTRPLWLLTGALLLCDKYESYVQSLFTCLFAGVTAAEEFSLSGEWYFDVLTSPNGPGQREVLFLVQQTRRVL